MHAHYFIDLPGVGQFELRRYTFGAHLDTMLYYRQLLRGTAEDTLPSELRQQFWVVAYLKSVIVKAPAGWSIEGLDIMAGEDQQLFELNSLIQAKEDSFRSPGKAGVAGSGEGPQQDAGLVVSGPLPPAA